MIIWYISSLQSGWGELAEVGQKALFFLKDSPRYLLQLLLTAVTQQLVAARRGKTCLAVSQNPSRRCAHTREIRNLAVMPIRVKWSLVSLVMVMSAVIPTMMRAGVMILRSIATTMLSLHLILGSVRSRSAVRTENSMYKDRYIHSLDRR